MKITKKKLDKLMSEYDWNKNTTLDTIGFLDYMRTYYSDVYYGEYKEYIKLIKEKEEENA